MTQKAIDNRSNKRHIHIIIDNVLYEGITPASKILNIPIRTIHRRVHSDNYPNYIKKSSKDALGSTLQPIACNSFEIGSMNDLSY